MGSGGLLSLLAHSIIKPEGNDFFGSDQDELAHPAHHVVLEITPWDHGSELSSAMMTPQTTVVADLTRRGDLLSLKPRDAVGDCHARRRPTVREAQ